MNAAVRAVARTAFFKGWDVVGKGQPLDPDLYRMAEILAELPE